MNELILFSPLGGTDPISMNNCRDGSMLHICRVYKPSKIILYMSKEILENQGKDNRYHYALDHLFCLQGRKGVTVEEIKRPELTNVQEFDFFYKEFREIIGRIFAEMDDSDRLLLNVSSGTPAMKSGLLVLQTLGEFPATMIQVSTPTGKMNEHIHKDYDIELLWDLNEDNESDFKNRCQIVQCPTLSKIKNEEIIKKHIAVYDYQAAVAVAETMQSEDTKSYLNYLKMAEARILLDFPTVDKWQKEIPENCLPVKSGNSRKYFEYALNLSIKLKRKEYADFIRGITPVIVDLFEIALKKQCSIDVNEYTKSVNGVRCWDKRKLEGTSLQIKLNENYNGDFRCGPVYSDHLRILIQSYSRDGRLRSLADDLRNVEANIRNMAAHQIVSITEDKIKKTTGFTGKQIMDKIISIFSYTGMNIEEKSWYSYDEMNQRILKAMESVEEITGK